MDWVVMTLFPFKYWATISHIALWAPQKNLISSELLHSYFNVTTWRINSITTLKHIRHTFWNLGRVKKIWIETKFKGEKTESQIYVLMEVGMQKT